LSLQVKPRIPETLDSSDDESGKPGLENRNVPPALQKGKKPAPSQETKKPSEQTIVTWGRGDDDMEPSSKMLALIKQLRIAESAGDKTIVYSQCKSLPPRPSSESDPRCNVLIGDDTE
jgi:hypothetical protein